MKLSVRRLERERKTIEAMIACYCRGVHKQPAGLCLACADLLDYATARLRRCPFQGDKPTCAKCPIHCYQLRRREEARIVMRYAGPRILWRHPILSLLHYFDAWRKVPPIPARAQPEGPTAER
jgi:hypothetical protein